MNLPFHHGRDLGGRSGVDLQTAFVLPPITTAGRDDGNQEPRRLCRRCVGRRRSSSNGEWYLASAAGAASRTPWDLGHRKGKPGRIAGFIRVKGWPAGRRLRKFERQEPPRCMAAWGWAVTSRFRMLARFCASFRHGGRGEAPRGGGGGGALFTGRRAAGQSKKNSTRFTQDQSQG